MDEQDDDIYDWMLLNSGKGWQTLSKRNTAINNTKRATQQAQVQAQAQAPQQAEPRQQQQEYNRHLQQQSTKKSGGFWSKLSCGLCQ